MKRLIKAAVLAVLALACLTAEATSTTISGTNVTYPIGFPLASGNFCFNGTCTAITNGSFSGTFTEATATVTITSGANTILTVPSVAIAAATYNWNTYTAASGVIGISGLGSPTIPCSAGALYTQNDSIPPYQPWICQAVGGSATWIAYTPPLNQSPAGHYAGTSVPTFNCTAPCDYVLTNAAPQTAAWYVLVAAKGTVSSNWQRQSGQVASGTPFVVTSGCGTTGAVTGGQMTGNFTAGQVSCIPIITPGFTAPNGFDCQAHDLTTPADSIRESSYTATTCTLTGTVVNADVIMVNIVAF
jgi:hypothetical protein